MATVKLLYEGDVQGEYVINPGETLSIGRRDTNNIVIENLVVSGSHAKLDALDEGYLLTDLRSKNGTFVNEVPINSHWLQDGDVVRIGKHSIQLVVDEDEAFALDVEDTMDETMVFGSSEFSQSITAQQAPAILTFLKGGQGDHALAKKLTKLGKDYSNDIVVSGFGVGQTAATISKLPEGYFISYVTGMSKPKINGKTVTESRKLEEFDEIEIGASRLQFYYK